jgi:large-conductance mechanosensitive channel
MPPFFKIVLRFVLDVLFGVIGFAIVGAAAYVLNAFIHWLEAGGVSPYIIQVLQLLEYGLFFVDILGFSFLVIIAFYKMVREIWRQRHDP